MNKRAYCHVGAKSDVVAAEKKQVPILKTNKEEQMRLQFLRQLNAIKKPESKRPAQCVYQEWDLFAQHGIGSAALSGFFAVADIDCFVVLHADVRHFSRFCAKVVQHAGYKSFEIALAKDALCCGPMVHFYICKTNAARVYELPFGNKPLAISYRFAATERCALIETLRAFFAAIDLETLCIERIDIRYAKQCLHDINIAAAAGKQNCYTIKTEPEGGTFLSLRLRKFICQTENALL